MRVTPNTFIRNAQQTIRQRSAQIAKLQNQVSTGTRIHKPSDDPLGFRTVESLMLFEGELSDRLETVSDMESTLNQSVTSLTEINNLVQSARRVLVDARSASDEVEREVYAGQIDGFLDRLHQLANSRDYHGFLFSGTTDQTEPFVVSDDGKITYAGSQRDSEVAVDSQVNMRFRYSGADIFTLPGRGETRISGHKQLQPGEGTSSANGRAKIAVAHVATTYAGRAPFMANLFL